jgi:hypothetical protein
MPISRILPSARSRAIPQRRLGSPRQHQPRAARHMIGQHRHRRPALGVVRRVHIIEDQRDR